MVVGRAVRWDYELVCTAAAEKDGPLAVLLGGGMAAEMVAATGCDLAGKKELRLVGASVTHLAAHLVGLTAPSMDEAVAVWTDYL